jgi:hypothetical protein
MIKDGQNTPVFSAYSAAVTPSPPVHGLILDVKHPSQANPFGAPLSGMAVKLIDSTGAVVESTTTNPDGYYSLYTPQPGQTYSVEVVAPVGFQPDAAGPTPNPVQFTYQAGDSARFDFGLDQLTTLSGTVFLDVDQDGAFGFPDFGVPGLEVYIDADDDGVLDPGTDPVALTRGPIFTGPAGVFSFYDVQPGTYTIRLNLPADSGFVPSNPQPFAQTITVGAGETYTIFGGANFGVIPQLSFTGMVQGYALEDGQLSTDLTGVPGATVFLYDVSTSPSTQIEITLTAADGSYSFDDVVLPPAGASTTHNYAVLVEAPAGWRVLEPDHAELKMGTPSTLSLAVSPQYTATGDYNDDGRIDLAVSDGTAVQLYLGNGDGTFTAGASWSYSRGVRQLGAFDYDGDGTPELAVFYDFAPFEDGEDQFMIDVVDYDASTGSFRLDTEQWTFFESSTIALSTAVAVRRPGAADVLAVVASSPDGTATSLVYLFLTPSYLNPLPTIFEPPGNPWPGGWAGNRTPLAVADVNQDGFDDLVYVATNTVGSDPLWTTFSTILGSATGYQLQDPYAQDDDGTGPLALADFNQDGLPDVIVGTTLPGGGIDYYYNVGIDPYFDEQTGTFLPGAYSPVKVIAQDVDGDLLPDLAFLSNTGSGYSVDILINSGNPGVNQFKAGTNVLSGPGVAQDMQAADFNNDGYVDLLVQTDQGGGQLALLLNKSEDVLSFIEVTVHGGDPISGVVSYDQNDFILAEVQDLAAEAVAARQVGGVVYGDINRNGRQDPGETGSGGVTVYLDRNGSGTLDAGDVSTATNAHGAYAFTGLADGTYAVRVAGEPGQVVTTGNQPYHLAITGGESDRHDNPDFGLAMNRPPAVTFPSGSDGALEGQQSFTLAGSYSDLDAVGITAVTVSWGDGTSSPAAVEAGRTGGLFTAGHVYADGGIYTVAVTVTNQDGFSTTQTVPAVVAGAGVHDGILVVVGTHGNDSISIDQQGSKRLSVAAGFLPAGGKPFDASTFEGITAFTRGGMDRVAVSRTVRDDVTVLPGEGGSVTITSTDRAPESPGQGSQPATPAPADPQAATLDAIYQELLGRAADPAGRAAWLSQVAGGASWSDVAAGIRASEEYRIVQVRDTYARLLGRDADEAGLRFWVAFLGSGGTADGLRARLLASDEYFGRHGGADGFVAALYHDLFGREADAAGWQYWRQQLQAGRSADAVVAAFLASDENRPS